MRFNLHTEAKCPSHGRLYTIERPGRTLWHLFPPRAPAFLFIPLGAPLSMALCATAQVTTPLELALVPVCCSFNTWCYNCNCTQAGAGVAKNGGDCSLTMVSNGHERSKWHAHLILVAIMWCPARARNNKRQPTCGLMSKEWFVFFTSVEVGKLSFFVIRC